MLKIVPVLGVLMVGLSVLAGCGAKGPETFPVSGQVLIDGEPLTHGFVQVVPNDARAAQAPIGEDGTFTLTSFENGDGCAPGTHPVAIIAVETLSPTSQKWHAPKKYMSPDTSGLTITVPQETDKVTLELTWDGAEPFVENFAAE